MKIRNGFVSNSSSSSFVVLFPREPKNASDVKDMLFTKDQNIYYYDDYDKVNWTCDSVAEIVWRDICNQEKNDLEKAEEIISGCSNYDYADAPDYDDFKYLPDGDDRWYAYYEAMNIYTKKKLKEFFNLRKLKLQKLNNEDVEDSVLYNFSYSDNEGSLNSAMEHGGLFDNLKCIKVNNH